MRIAAERVAAQADLLDQRARCARGAPAASISGRSASRPSSRMSATRMRGFSDANGSWKMIWMLAPRRAQRVALAGSNRSLAVEQRAALDHAPAPRSSCTMALPVVVLPQPDSPTSASVSPRAIVERHAVARRRSSRARAAAGRGGSGSARCRCCTSSSGAAGVPTARRRRAASAAAVDLRRRASPAARRQPRGCRPS